MSYDLYLSRSETGETIELAEKHQLRGGTYAVGGTTEAHLNVTWNYGRHFARVLGVSGIRTIYGLAGAESIPVLEKAIGELGDDATDNYWDATEGNAARALRDLVALAKLAPEDVWAGD